MNFIILTDESIVTGDTFTDVNYLKTNGNKFKSDWYTAWQANSSNANKFPTSHEPGAVSVANGINAALT